jgi:hypothetical protein
MQKARIRSGQPQTGDESMNFKESDLPLSLKHGEMLTLDNGSTIRFESNGEAKDIMINEDFSPAVTLFPSNDFFYEAGGKKYKMTAAFEDILEITKV